MTLDQIQTLTRTYADERSALAAQVSACQAELVRVTAQWLPGIKQCLARAAEAHDALHAAVEAAPAAFEKPKTQTWHGVRVGYLAGSDGVEWDDDEVVITLVERELPHQADVLIKTAKSLRKKALKALDASTLTRIGCRTVDGEERVLIKPVDEAVDKLVNALLKSAQTNGA